MEYSCTRQRPDGSWWYAEDAEVSLDRQLSHRLQPGQPDVLHRRHRRSRSSRRISTEGLAFFKEHFFEEDGRPRYYHTRTYPVDIQCAAQAIDTLSLFAERDPECLALAATGGRWTIRNMQHARRLLLLSPVSPGHVENPDAPLGAGDDVQGLGSSRPRGWDRRSALALAARSRRADRAGVARLAADDRRHRESRGARMSSGSSSNCSRLPGSSTGPVGGTDVVLSTSGEQNGSGASADLVVIYCRGRGGSRRGRPASEITSAEDERRPRRTARDGCRSTGGMVTFPGRRGSA